MSLAEYYEKQIDKLVSYRDELKAKSDKFEQLQDRLYKQFNITISAMKGGIPERN